jgi:hypothetical protein
MLPLQVLAFSFGCLSVVDDAACGLSLSDYHNNVVAAILLPLV